MTSVLASLALITSTATLLAIPLAPALRELFAKEDAGPLVTRKDNGRIDNFARSLRLRYQAFRTSLFRVEGLDATEHLDTESGSLFLVGTSGSWKWGSRVETEVLCAKPIQLPERFQSTQNVYCADHVLCGRDSLFRTLMSEASIDLGRGTQVLRWIHAEENLEVGIDCRLFGRASAGKSIVLSPGTKFERIAAPVIYSSAAAANLDVRQDPAAFTKLAQAGMGRTRRLGRVRLEAKEQHFGDLVATRGLEICENASVFGSVKANGDVKLHERAEVEGSVVATKRVHVGAGCYVKGPLISEYEIVIGPGVQVGLPNSPTTVSAPRIQIASGSVLHGTVWARVEGRVEG